jgi:hypothetical protein
MDSFSKLKKIIIVSLKSFKNLETCKPKSCQKSKMEIKQSFKSIFLTLKSYRFNLQIKKFSKSITEGE